MIHSFAAAALMMGVAALPFQAKADYLFSGTVGSSGTLVSSGETWLSGSSSGLSFWGTPGPGLGDATYGESQAATGFDITFTGGGPIDPGAITLGNANGCLGDLGGGTTACTFGDHKWTATQTGLDSISFTAPSAADDLTDGEGYFINIFFVGDPPGPDFSGRWVTAASSVPEPGALILFGTALAGLAGLGLMRRR